MTATKKQQLVKLTQEIEQFLTTAYFRDGRKNRWIKTRLFNKAEELDVYDATLTAITINIKNWLNKNWRLD